MGAAIGRVLAKLNWANEHINKLNGLTDEFRSTHRDTVRPETDTETGDTIYRVAYVPDLPESFSLLLGDALYNLRSTLDHLAHELVTVAGNKPTPQTAFPIFDSDDEYWESFARKVKGMRQEVIEEISRLRPYKGGFGHALWQLHRLNNFDKHRFLLTTAFVNVARTFTPSEERDFKARYERVHGGSPSARLKIKYTLGDATPRPLKAGDVLYTVPAAEVDKHMGFGFDIAVDEPQAVTPGHQPGNGELGQGKNRSSTAAQRQ